MEPPRQRRRTLLPTCSSLSPKRATCFSLSPQKLAEQAALSEKTRNPHGVQLTFQFESLTVEEAALKPKGYHLCVSPFERGSNNYFQNLQRLSDKLDAINFFVNLLQSSIKMCAVDLVQFLAYWIDYHLRRCFKARQDAQGKDFRNRFIGKAKSKPFKGTNAERIRYVYLLTARIDQRTPSDEAAAYEALLAEAENALLESMKHCHCPPMEASELRAELRAFFVGGEKRGQDLGRHLFTDLIYQDRRHSLDKQWLNDPIFPPRRDDAFDLNNVQVLLNLGLKVIALADLERRIQERRTTDIVACTPKLNQVAVCLVRAFLRKHVNISYSFKYDSMVGLLEGASSSVVKEYDLNDLRMALSPDGQTLVLEEDTDPS